MHTTPVDSISLDTLWPRTVVDDLKARYLVEAAEQCGVSSSNAFINGSLHDFYSYTLATGDIIQEVTSIETGDGPIDLSQPIAENADRRPAVIVH